MEPVDATVYVYSRSKKHKEEIDTGDIKDGGEVDTEGTMISGKDEADKDYPGEDDDPD